MEPIKNRLLCAGDHGGVCVLAVEFRCHGQTHGHALPAEHHGPRLGVLTRQVEVGDAGGGMDGGNITGIHAAACQQMDPAGGLPVQAGQQLRPVSGGCRLPGGEDGVHAQGDGVFQCGKGIPAHIEAPVQGDPQTLPEDRATSTRSNPSLT